MSKQNQAVIAIACTSGLSLIVWMICAVLYFTGSQSVADSGASPPVGTAGEILPDAVAATVDSAPASSDSDSQAKQPVLPSETESVDAAARSEPQPAVVPAENKLDGRFPFSVFEKPITMTWPS